MKIQCSCGAKFAFEPQPEMRGNPIRFECPSCHVDLSPYLQTMVEQEFPDPQAAQELAAQNAGQPAIHAAPVMIEAPAASAPGLRVRKEARIAHAPDKAAQPAAAVSDEPQICARHPDHYVSNECYICHKPICPKCLELFGYLCGPLCKSRANSHGIHLPVFEGQRDLTQARFWRKVTMVGWSVGLLVVLFLGVWTWYVWFGSSPRPVFSLRFPSPAMSGQSIQAGKDQLVFLHGDLLARYDMKTKKEIWEEHLIDPRTITVQVDREIKGIQKAIDNANNEGWERVPKMPSKDSLTHDARRYAEAALELRVRGENIWIASPGKLSRYDWNNGNLVSEIPVKSRYGGLIALGDDLMVVDVDHGKPIASKVNLVTGQAQEEVIGAAPSKALLLADGDGTGGGPGVIPNEKNPGGGLPIGMPGKDMDKPLDPEKVARQAQSLSYPGRIALPAVLAGNLSQERALKEMDDQGKPRPNSAKDKKPEDDVSLVPTRDGFLELGVRLLEEKLVARSAMKAAPSKSVLDGVLTVDKTSEAANEILNEMQRSRGGDLVYDDLSRFQVTVKRADGQGEWTGEMISHPRLYPLKTVNVVSAGKGVVVLDKMNKKLWDAQLAYDVHGALGEVDEDNSPYGRGPCVEQNQMLYIYDAAVLTAFDLRTGAVKWRFPSVGISGLFFDGKGMIYVNTTTASPETIRYSRQIDINARNSAVVMKIDSKSGKTVWTAEPGGLINYVSGKNIFVVRSFLPEEADTDDPYTPEDMASNPPFLRIKKLNPKNGREMWQHFQQRGPLDVQFQDNTIRLLFKNEIQVLKFFSL